jgi:hypothetical protein
MRSSVMQSAILIGLAVSGDAGGQAVVEVRSVVAPVTDRIVTGAALLPVPRNVAFEYFTRNDLLESWLTAAADVEAVEGGRYELFWEPERSPRQYKEFANRSDPLTHVVVLFVPEGAGTRVHLVHSGWRSDPEWEEARRWQDRAWAIALRQLERVVPRE